MHGAWGMEHGAGRDSTGHRVQENLKRATSNQERVPGTQYPVNRLPDREQPVKYFGINRKVFVSLSPLHRIYSGKKGNRNKTEVFKRYILRRSL